MGHLGMSQMTTVLTPAGYGDTGRPTGRGAQECVHGEDVPVAWVGRGPEAGTGGEDFLVEGVQSCWGLQA